jgi:hypothetical protein
MPGRRDFHKIIVGRSETINLIDYLVKDLPAKVDTGAFRSAIHASEIYLNEQKSTLSFKILGDHPIFGAMHKQGETKEFSKVWVASSFGQREERFEVKLKVKLGSRIFVAKFTLADRSKKIYPILLGRQLLNNRFLVDPAESSVDRAELKQEYDVNFPSDEEEGRVE